MESLEADGQSFVDTPLQENSRHDQQSFPENRTRKQFQHGNKRGEKYIERKYVGATHGFTSNRPGGPIHPL
jgi:pyocin large subunit-like protein